VTTTTTLNPIPVTPRLLGAEHVVMVGAALALLVLVQELAIVTMLLITAAIALASRFGRGSAGVPRRGTGLESAQ